MKILEFLSKIYGKMIGAGAEIWDKLEPELEPKFFYKPEPEPHNNGPAPQHWAKNCIIQVPGNGSF
jgi:hypothetical protein